MISTPARRLRNLRFVAASVVLALSTMACTGGQPVSLPAQASADGSPPVKSLLPEGGGHHATAVSRIDEIADYTRNQFPDLFAGVAADGATTVVYRITTADRGLDAAVSRKFPSEPVRFVDAPRSARELDGLARRIADDHTILREDGIIVSAVGPDFARGVVIVNTKDPAKAGELLGQRYGKAVLVAGPAPEVTPAR